MLGNLCDAIRYLAEHTYYNVFVGRATREEYRDAINAQPRYFTGSFMRFLRDRGPNNPWLYYGHQFK